MREYIGVSELGLCHRRVLYQHRSDLHPHATPEAQRKMALGHLVETLRRRELRKEGVRVFAPQLEVRFGPAIGHIDGFTKTSTGPVLWECKSTSSFSIAKWHKEGLPRPIAYQVHGYMEGLSSALCEPVERCQIEVVDRTSGEVHSWLYGLDRAVLGAARERAEHLARLLEKGIIPEPEYEATSSECRYCPFRITCRPELEIPDVSQSCADANGWPGMPEAVSLYAAGQDLKEEGEALVSQAKEILQQQLLAHGATKARVNGSLVLWSQVETTRFDGKAFQREKPELYAQYLKPSTYQRLEIRR